MNGQRLYRIDWNLSKEQFIRLINLLRKCSEWEGELQKLNIYLEDISHSALTWEVSELIDQSFGVNSHQSGYLNKWLQQHEGLIDTPEDLYDYLGSFREQAEINIGEIEQIVSRR